MRALAGCLLIAACAGAQARRVPQGPVALRLTDLDGEIFTLGGLRGRPVLVTVITTWSDPALMEVPRIKAVVDRQPDLAVVAIALDDDPRMVSIFEETFEIPYRLAFVDDRAAFTSADGPFGEITVIPTSILLDETGEIVARMDGMWPPEVLERAVQKVAGGIDRD